MELKNRLCKTLLGGWHCCLVSRWPESRDREVGIKHTSKPTRNFRAPFPRLALKMLCGTAAVVLTLTASLGVAFGQVSFGAPVNLPIPSATPATVDVNVGDFNGNGNVDIVATFNDNPFPVNPAWVAVFLGDGTGTFGTTAAFFAGPGCWTAQTDSLQVADYNNDGKPDLSITHGGSNNLCFGNKVSIHLNDGLGGVSFTTAAPGFIFSTGGSIAPHVPGDFNGDGNLDIAITTFDSSLLRVHLGSGTGTFGGAVLFSSRAEGLVAADFNADGRLDLAIASRSGPDANTVRILFGTGTGSFTVAQTFPLAGAGEIRGGDFNGDAILDLVVSSPAGSGTVNVLLGLGGGIFASPVSFPAGPSAGEIAVADYDGDGNLDLAVTNGPAGTVSVLLGDGAGGFGAPIPFPAGTPGGGLKAADLNGDGKVDLVSTSVSGVNILFNNTVTEIPVAIDIKPGSDPNSINLCGAGVIPVAIFGSDDFPVSDIDISTLRLGDGTPGSGSEVKMAGKSGKELCSTEDVDLDGFDDLVCKFVTVDLNLAGGDTDATVLGSTTGAEDFVGTDSINIVKDCG